MVIRPCMWENGVANEGSRRMILYSNKFNELAHHCHRNSLNLYSIIKEMLRLATQVYLHTFFDSSNHPFLVVYSAISPINNGVYSKISSSSGQSGRCCCNLMVDRRKAIDQFSI